MSIEEREDRLGQLPSDLTRQPLGVAGPNYNPRNSGPPDLIYNSLNNRPPPPPGQQADLGEVNQGNNSQLFRALRRQGYFMTEPFQATTTPKLLRPFESRTYLFIQNISAANDIILGFGNIPSAGDGLSIIPSAAYEPWTIPVNEIYVISSAGTVNGYIIYARENEN